MDQLLEPNIVIDADLFYSVLTWDGGQTEMMIKPEVTRDLTGDSVARSLDVDVIRMIEHPD